MCWFICCRNTSILYAGGATCGLWKSENKGLYWNPLFDTELMINEVYSLEVDFLNPDIVYFSAGDDLYRTLDGGNTYELLYQMSFIKDLVIHPNDNNILYICSEERLYRLNISENNLETIVLGDILELEFHPTESNIIYIVRRVNDKTEFLNGESRIPICSGGGKTRPHHRFLHYEFLTLPEQRWISSPKESFIPAEGKESRRAENIATLQLFRFNIDDGVNKEKPFKKVIPYFRLYCPKVLGTRFMAKKL